MNCQVVFFCARLWSKKRSSVFGCLGLFEGVFGLFRFLSMVLVGVKCV